MTDKTQSGPEFARGDGFGEPREGLPASATGNGPDGTIPDALWRAVVQRRLVHPTPLAIKNAIYLSIIRHHMAHGDVNLPSWIFRAVDAGIAAANREFEAEREKAE